MKNDIPTIKIHLIGTLAYLRAFLAGFTTALCLCALLFSLFLIERTRLIGFPAETIDRVETKLP